MIVTDKFVFVHFPRTGGTFITDVIMRFFPSAQEIGYHLPRFLLPNEYSRLPVLGTVRNPWEFYVSWYYHVWPRDAATPLTSWLTENGEQQFEGATRCGKFVVVAWDITLSDSITCSGTLTNCFSAGRNVCERT